MTSRTDARSFPMIAFLAKAPMPTFVSSRLSGRPAVSVNSSRAAMLGILLYACAGMLPAQAQTLPQWELGIGLAGVTLPSYRGAETRRSYVLPAPYVVYRGERFHAERGGVRAELLRNDLFELNVSANLSLARTGNDDPIRSGMSSLRPVAEFGPTADFALWRSADRNTSLAFRVPLRAGFTIESSPRHIGWLLAPNLILRTRDPLGLRGWGLGVQGGPQFADGRWHDYYYGVRADEATPVRSAYDASGGYSGMQVTTTLYRRYPRYWVGGYIRYDNLAGAAFRDSPLVRKEQGVTAGFAVTWIFGASSKSVQAQD